MSKAAKSRIRFFAVMAVVALGIWAGHQAGSNDVVREAVTRFGYVGIFVVAVVSGFNLVVPVPAVAFVPLFLASGFDFVPTIAVIAVGVTCADSVAYLLGRAGRGIVAAGDWKVVTTLERLKRRHYWAPIVAMFVYACVAPLPNEVLVMPLGFMRYRFAHVLPALFAGNVVFNALTASGVVALSRSLG